MATIIVAFPGGKHKALTMSYDDGQAADRRLVSIFNQYGIKGTFHLNSGLMGQGGRIGAEEAAALYDGHEISAHTATHPTIERSPNETLVMEIMEDRKKLERIAGYTVRGMSYPNGSYNRSIMELLPRLGIEYSRIVPSTNGFGMPDDWHEWKPTCHHKQRLMELAESFVGLQKKQYLYLMYVWGHSYEFDQDGNWELIEEFCRYVGGRDDIWYATNIEIVEYMQAFERLKFAADCSFVRNPSAQAVWLIADGRTVEVPGGETVMLD